MNELIKGNERDVTVTYTVSASHGNHESRDFDDAAAAAKAFHEIDANDRPVAIRVKNGPDYGPGGSGQIVADTSGIGEPGKPIEYFKGSSRHDPEFDSAYRKLRFVEQIKAETTKDEGPDERRASLGIEGRQIAYNNAISKASNELEPGAAQAWAELDAREFRKLSDPSRIEDAAVFMQGNRENLPEYGAALQKIAPEIVGIMEATKAEHEHRVSLKEVGKAMDAEVMAARDADAFEVPRYSAQEDRAPEIVKSPEEALQSLVERNGQRDSIETVSPREAATQARADQADYAQLDAAGKTEAARLLVGNFKNREYAAEFARHDPEAVQEVIRNADKGRDAQVGTPMKSMPGAVMIYNDQPGMRGADILTADGRQISFGGPEAIEAFAKENKLAAEDVAVLKALDAQADKYRTPNVEDRLPSRMSVEDLPAMDIDPRALAAMEKNRNKEMAAVREGMGDQGTAISGDAAAKTPTVDKQVAELDARMEKAKLEELGWRDRDDISDVMRDLEKLAAKDWQVAADLWQKYRPNDIDKPVFIDGDDIDEKGPAKASTRDDARGVDGGKEEAAGVVTPDALRKRFLQAENKFYFRDDENKLAFEDKGKRLATEHNDPEIARSMVELAQAKGWSTIKLKGTDEFKREVWLQASLKGMDVQGYKPLDVDLARLEDLRKETGRNEDHGRNIIDRVPERSKAGDRAERTEAVDKTAVVDENTRTLSKRQLSALETIKGVMRARGDSETAVNMAAELAAERFQTNRVYVGKVVDHGAAPYENDPKNERSYYVKLQTDAGEKIVWGVDLERAVGDGKAQIGDDVALAYQGKQPVTVPVKEYDDKGKVVGVSEITTNRNTWDVRRLETVREEVKEKLAEAARKSDRQPLVKVYDRDAERTTARPEVVREQRTKDNERAHGARG